MQEETEFFIDGFIMFLLLLFLIFGIFFMLSGTIYFIKMTWGL